MARPMGMNAITRRYVGGAAAWDRRTLGREVEELDGWMLSLDRDLEESWRWELWLFGAENAVEEYVAGRRYGIVIANLAQRKSDRYPKPAQETCRS